MSRADDPGSNLRTNLIIATSDDDLGIFYGIMLIGDQFPAQSSARDLWVLSQRRVVTVPVAIYIQI